ncbi:MAG: histidine triad nucleotide-binding protein [Anaerolineales bacterium]|uniref:histidine triad nucleotide-binding protein n=1 Tax=Candidatus Villigracilis vicinus TaxID=3140679 RepID=UPI003135849E|nr:histidine triad nucleotide-binding protein [Anaerolineales bacterium]
MSDCIFCKIINGEIPSTSVYQDEQAYAFRDIQPAAPTHILIVPRKHIDSINAMTDNDEQTIGHLFNAARQIAAQEGLAENGYRLVINTNAHAGQTVFHIHLHLLGGRQLTKMG